MLNAAQARRASRAAPRTVSPTAESYEYTLMVRSRVPQAVPGGRW